MVGLERFVDAGIEGEDLRYIDADADVGHDEGVSFGVVVIKPLAVH